MNFWNSIKLSIWTAKFNQNSALHVSNFEYVYMEILHDVAITLNLLLDLKKLLSMSSYCFDHIIRSLHHLAL